MFNKNCADHTNLQNCQFLFIQLILYNILSYNTAEIYTCKIIGICEEKTYFNCIFIIENCVHLDYHTFDTCIYFQKLMYIVHF